MSNLQKTIEAQKVINEAVEEIINYFGHETPYAIHLEQMADAQIQILELLELARTAVRRNKNSDFDNNSDEIIYFLRDVRQYLKLLKPFIELTGQVYGTEWKNQ